MKIVQSPPNSKIIGPLSDIKRNEGGKGELLVPLPPGFQIPAAFLPQLFCLMSDIWIKVVSSSWLLLNLFLSSLKMLYFRGSLPKWILTHQKKNSCHILKNWYLDMLSTSKWPSEPQFCERWTYIWPKSGQKRSYIGHL